MDNDFEANLTSGICPFEVAFKIISDIDLFDRCDDGIKYLLFDFGDGLYSTSLSFFHNHTYTKIGTYSVSLYLSNEYISYDLNQYGYIEVNSNIKPISKLNYIIVSSFYPQFSVNYTKLFINKLVIFQIDIDDLIFSQVNFILFDFGDGSYSDILSKKHYKQYTKEGIYTVTLYISKSPILFKVKNGIINVISNKCLFYKTKINCITIIELDKLDFYAIPTFCVGSLYTKFTLDIANSDFNLISDIRFEFGDDTSSILKQKEYTKTYSLLDCECCEKYNVNLYVGLGPINDLDYTESVKKEEYIHLISKDFTFDITVDNDHGFLPLEINFKIDIDLNVYMNCIKYILIDFGDGNYKYCSDEFEFNHIYTTEGLFTVIVYMSYEQIKYTVNSGIIVEGDCCLKVVKPNLIDVRKLIFTCQFDPIEGLLELEVTLDIIITDRVLEFCKYILIDFGDSNYIYSTTINRQYKHIYTVPKLYYAAVYISDVKINFEIQDVSDVDLNVSCLNPQSVEECRKIIHFNPCDNPRVVKCEENIRVKKILFVFISNHCPCDGLISSLSCVGFWYNFSFIFISGSTKSDLTPNRLKLQIDGLPSGYKIPLKDDDVDIYTLETNKLTSEFNWAAKKTDGMIVNSIDSFSTITVQILESTNIDKIRIKSNVRNLTLDVNSVITFNKTQTEFKINGANFTPFIYTKSPIEFYGFDNYQSSNQYQEEKSLVIMPYYQLITDNSISAFTVTFTISITDEDFKLVRYLLFDFGDGTYSQIISKTHTKSYITTGIFTVILYLSTNEIKFNVECKKIIVENVDKMHSYKLIDYVNVVEVKFKVSPDSQTNIKNSTLYFNVTYETTTFEPSSESSCPNKPAKGNIWKTFEWYGLFDYGDGTYENKFSTIYSHTYTKMGIYVTVLYLSTSIIDVEIIDDKLIVTSDSQLYCYYTTVAIIDIEFKILTYPGSCFVPFLNYFEIDIDHTVFESFVKYVLWDFGDSSTSILVSYQNNHTYKVVHSFYVSVYLSSKPIFYIPGASISGTPGLPGTISNPDVNVPVIVSNLDGLYWNRIQIEGFESKIDFSATPTSGSNPLNVTFTITSSDQTQLSIVKEMCFNFGDGTCSTPSMNLTASHTYSADGKYTVILYISCVSGQITIVDNKITNTDLLTITKTEYIIVYSLITLTCVKMGLGSGLVTSLDTLINCGSVCSAAVSMNSSYSLTATPDNGSAFKSWNYVIDGITSTFSTNPLIGDLSTTDLTIYAEFVLTEADYVVITYYFNSSGGIDLDTVSQVIQPYVGGEVGYGRNSEDAPYLTWSGDNTGTGTECVMFNMKAFLIEYPSKPPVQFKCSAHWFGSISSGEMSLDIKGYKDGTMSLSNFEFFNTGGSLAYQLSYPFTITSRYNNPQHLATFQYLNSSLTKI